MKITELSIKDSVLVAIGDCICTVEDIQKNLTHTYHDTRKLTKKQISNAVYSLCKDGRVKRSYNLIKSYGGYYYLTTLGDNRYNYFIDMGLELFDGDNDILQPSDFESNENGDIGNVGEGQPSLNDVYDLAMKVYDIAMKVYQLEMNKHAMNNLS